MSVQIIQGDASTVLKTLPDESVNCCVTSPPYWGLRDYGVEGQLGLERTPEEYVSNMVEVFREVRRVLRDDGTLWLNLGDSYNANGRDGHGTRIGYKQGTNRASADGSDSNRPTAPGLKPKDLVGIPWMVAFALRADGWYLRQDIIWHKPNPMPESVTDRCTKAHEYIFLMSKSQRYFYDCEAVKEPVTGTAHRRCSYKTPDGLDTGKGSHGSFHKEGREKGQTGYQPKARRGVTPKSAQPGSGIKANESFHAACVDLVDSRNLRSVWTVSTAPFPGAHFATFPPKLIEPCILAGCPDKCCPKCGKGWERLVERKDKGYNGSKYGERIVNASGGVITGGTAKSTLGSSNGKLTGTTTTIGFRPSCSCGDPCIEFNSIPGTVLDPFGGSGTVGMIAEQHGRNSILIELNPKYIEMAKRRTAQQNIFAGLAN